jgi:hypothetical protein
MGCIARLASSIATAPCSASWLQQSYQKAFVTSRFFPVGYVKVELIKFALAKDGSSDLLTGYTVMSHYRKFLTFYLAVLYT